MGIFFDFVVRVYKYFPSSAKSSCTPFSLSLSRESSSSNVVSSSTLTGALAAVPRSYVMRLVAPNPLQHPLDGVQPPVQISNWRAEREPDEVVARGVEQVSTVRGVDVEEDSGDHDRFFLKELFEEGLPVRTRTRAVRLVWRRGEGTEMELRTRPLFKGCGRSCKFSQM